MLIDIVFFLGSLILLLGSAKFFTESAERVGKHFRLPSFVIGVFILGMGTSLPELFSGVIAVLQDSSEILMGNIIGDNISNLLLITGLSVILYKKDLIVSSFVHIYTDLQFLIGSFIVLGIIAFDGKITWIEAIFGLFVFFIYGYSLITRKHDVDKDNFQKVASRFPYLSLVVIVATSLGMYYGANFTIDSINKVAESFQIPTSIIALTVLSLGTTLPELTVNVGLIKQKKADMAIGNILGSCIINALFIPAIGSFFGAVRVPNELLHFPLPIMGAAGLLFYFLVHDRKISLSEGYMLVFIYLLFILQVVL